MIEGPTQKCVRVGLPRGFFAAAAAAAMALSLVVAPPVATADELTDAANQEQEAQARLNQLRTDLNGIDATLAQIYIDLDKLKAQIPVAETELAAAQTRRDAAEREHAVAAEQLQASIGEQERLQREVAEAQETQADATKKIGGLARQMYRGGVASPMVMMLSADGTAEINQRAAATDILAKSQERALEAALATEATQRNQEARQNAVTDRVTELENIARSAAEAAKAAELEAVNKISELNQLQESARQKQAEWDSKKNQAVTQLDAAEAAHREASARLSKLNAEAALASNSASSASGRNGFVSPITIPMVVTSPFGPRLHPVLGIWRMHLGVDFAVGCGMPVLSTRAGVVSAVYANESGGNMVFVNHGTIGGVNVSSAYLHLQQQTVSVGQTVTAGQQVGTVGSTGYSTGCHLHFSIMENGVDVDPMGYM